MDWAHPMIIPASESVSSIRYRLKLAFQAFSKERIQKNNFLISQPKHFVGAQKNRLNETVLLSTQNICYN